MTQVFRSCLYIVPSAQKVTALSELCSVAINTLATLAVANVRERTNIFDLLNRRPIFGKLPILSIIAIIRFKLVQDFMFNVRENISSTWQSCLAPSSRL